MPRIYFWILEFHRTGSFIRFSVVNSLFMTCSSSVTPSCVLTSLLSVQCNTLHRTLAACFCGCFCVSGCWCVCVRTGIGGQISRKRLEIEVRLQWDANRKLHMADRLVTWAMTSRDLERSRSWPRYKNAHYLEMVGDRDSVTIEHLSEMAHGESNGHVTDDVTSPRKVKVVTQI